MQWPTFSQNLTHATDTHAMSTPNATTVEGMQSANVMMDMWEAANIAEVSFCSRWNYFYFFSKKFCDRFCQIQIFLWLLFPCEFLEENQRWFKEKKII